jgi:uncharacterized protein DUF1573
MLRYSFVLLAGLWAISPAWAGSWADALFDELSKDFGSVPRGPTLQHPFRIKNTTKNTITISGVRVSCNVCSRASLLKSTLEPGEETSVVVTMDTSKFSGVKTITVYVNFSQPSYEEVRLWVQANGRDDISFSPDTIAFGKTKRGAAPNASTTVTFLGIPQAQITEAKCESNYLQPTFKEVKREGSEVSYQLSVKLRADAPVGKWFADVWVKTNVASMPKVRVPLTVEIESALTLSPSAVALGDVKMGEEVERRVILKGVKPFKISSIKGVDDQISVKDNSTESKQVHVLTVTLKGAKTGEINRKLQIVTDLTEDGSIEFQATGQIIAKPSE